MICDQCSIAGVSLDCPCDCTSSHTGHMLILVGSVYASACDGPSISGANGTVHIQCN